MLGIATADDLSRDIVKDGFFFGKADLGASLRSAAVCGIVPIRGAFGSDTKTRNRLASGRVRVKLGLKIFQVKSKVQNIDFLKFVFRHVDPPISGWQFKVADLLARDTLTAMRRSTGSSVLYFG
jgi:hypothetical protein